MGTFNSGGKIRKPSSAGLFYPADPDSLRNLVESFTGNPPQLKDRDVIGIIVPHAGYQYSGPVAGLAYGEIRDREFERVIVISPSHREAFNTVSIFPGDYYESPLGRVRIDSEFCGRLEKHCDITESSYKGHSPSQGAEFGEHALEVQIPFLQQALGEFSLVPLVMGRQDFNASARLGSALSELSGDSKTLIVASSDLSHFHDYETAKSMDLTLVDAIAQMDYFSLSSLIQVGEVEACGGGPIIAAMVAAEKMGAEESRVLDYKNSGDTESGSKDRVVGYTSAVLARPSGNSEQTEFQPNIEEQAFLLSLARLSVEAAVKGIENTMLKEEMPSRMQEKKAVFVTLTEESRLRGCIGSIIPQDRLFKAVADSAVNAALHDPRFEPVREEELPFLSFEISVLSRFRKVSDVGEIVIGKHGLLIESGFSKGLLLPQVAESHSWDVPTFLEQTCIKASLPRNAWKDPSADLLCFTASVFGSE